MFTRPDEMEINLFMTGFLKGDSYWKWLLSQKWEPILCLSKHHCAPVWATWWPSGGLYTLQAPCTWMLNLNRAIDICNCPSWCYVVRIISIPFSMVQDHLKASLYLQIRRVELNSHRCLFRLYVIQGATPKGALCTW